MICLQKCYSPAEIAAVFEAGDIIAAEKLTQLSPALLYQKLYTNCVVAPNTTSATNNEPTWHSTHII
jgi:hypothetical protein